MKNKRRGYKEALPLRPVILCDFDGTISTMDVADTIFTVYLGDRWDEIDQEWHDGHISMAKLYEKCWSLVDAGEDELKDFVDRIDIDPFVVDFVAMVKWANIPLYLVSDGFGFYIDRIIDKYGLAGLKHYSNILSFDDEGKPVPAFNNRHPDCGQCANCKKFVMEDKRAVSDFVIYIGNGLSDRCAAEHADLVFAKDSLRDYCEKNGIDFVSYGTFDDIIGYFKEHKLIGDDVKTSSR